MNVLYFNDQTYLSAHKLGFKLNANQAAGDALSIGQLFALPYDVFMLDLEGKTIKINQAGAEICGFQSPEHAIGQTVLHGDACETAEILLDNCQQVFRSEQTQLYDEVLKLANKTSSHLFSIKQPLYDESEQLVGSIGVSIVVGKRPIAQALQELTELGFLYPKQEKSEPSLNLNGVELTSRERETLEWMSKGYSAKMIAKELSISYRTVEDYQRQLKQKFNVATKARATKKKSLLNPILVIPIKSK